MDQLNHAIRFATYCHAKQVRKYSGQPYILHPLRVLATVAESEIGQSEDVLCAAVLHDVVEDNQAKTFDIAAYILQVWGDNVSTLVDELTNPSSKLTPPLPPRAERKALDFAHLATVSREAKIIKLFDRIDNIVQIENDIQAGRNVDRGWVKLYLKESYDLYEIIKSASKHISMKLSMELGLLHVMQDIVLGTPPPDRGG